MADSVSEDDFKGYFTENDDAMYVVTDNLPRLKLKDQLSPEEAPLYIDLDTGVGVYAEGLDPEVASRAAKYAMSKAGREDTPFHLSQDTETWENEFSELIGDDVELGPFWSYNLDEKEETPTY